MSEQIQQAIQSLSSAVAKNPATAKAVFRASTVSTADSFSTDSTIRSFDVRNDEPIELGGTDSGPNPVEAVLAALGSCQAIVYRAYANALGLQLDRVEVETRGHLDIRGFLGNPEVPAGFERVAFTTSLVSPEPADMIEALASLVEKHCPVLDILRRPMAVTGTYRHVTPGSSQEVPEVATLA